MSINHDYQMSPPKADTSGPEPTMDYTSEEMDFVREMMEEQRRAKVEADDAQ